MRAAALLGVLPLTLACGGPTVGEVVEQRITITLGVTSSQPEVAVAGDAQGGLGVTRAFVAASAMTLGPCSDDVGSIVLGARGYDLRLSPSEEVTTAVSDFCALELDLDPVDETATKGVPDGATLYAEATDADGVEHRFSSARSYALRFESSSGRSWGPALILGFDLSLWLTGLPLAEPDGADAETELFETQLRSAVALYADSNGNQLLDDDETTPIALTAPTR